MMDNVERFALVTKISELEAQLAAARKSLRDDVAIAFIKSGNAYLSLSSPASSYRMTASLALDFADAFMIERDKR